MPFSKQTEVAVRAAREAGQYALARRKGAITVREKTRHLDYVTDVDTGCESMIREILLSETPGSRFFGEECGVPEAEIKQAIDHMAPGERIWVVDPLDGTINYVHGLGLYCVSIGLMEDGEPVSGAIYIPALDEMFAAEKGQGAWLNGRRIHVSDTGLLEEALVGYSVPVVNPEQRRAFERCYPLLSGSVQNARILGSCAAAMAYTACGALDGYMELGHHPWDVAAGMLLVREAGGEATNFAGEPFSASDHRLVLSNGRIHSGLLGIVDGIRDIAP